MSPQLLLVNNKDGGKFGRNFSLLTLEKENRRRREKSTEKRRLKKRGAQKRDAERSAEERRLRKEKRRSLSWCLGSDLSDDYNRRQIDGSCPRSMVTIITVSIRMILCLNSAL